MSASFGTKTTHEFNVNFDANTLKEEAKKAAGEAVKQAGREACFDLVKECVDSLMETVETQKIDPTDLVDSKVKPLSIPEVVNQQIASLSQQIAYVINKVAIQIEESNYENWRDALKDLSDMPETRRQQLEKLIEGEKQINVSVQSLAMTVDVFAHINKEIISELEAAQNAGDQKKERKLILYNAVLIHELCKAVLKYLDQFKLFGMDQIREVDRAIHERAQKANSHIANLERFTNDPAIDPVTAEAYKTQVRNSRAIMDQMLKTWQEYKSQTDQTCAQTIKACGDLRTRIEAKKESAATQICLLNMASMIGMMRSTFQEFQQITATVEGLELTGLTPERVTSLFLQGSY